MRFYIALLLFFLPCWVIALPICREDMRLTTIFDEMHLVGTIVVFDTIEDACFAHDMQRAQKPYLPASTFKIFNALTALETGVIRDEHDIFRWDGKQREIRDWNRDHDLASGMQYSVVWYYQELARRIGAVRMQEWIDKVGYGNQNISGGIDRFWLGGGALRITALQQIAFLQRLHDGTLPFSARSQDIVKRILIRDQTSSYILRFKTGWAGDNPPMLGWIVGWIERDGHVAYFATNLDMQDSSYAKREALARAALRALEWLPESSIAH